MNVNEIQDIEDIQKQIAGIDVERIALMAGIIAISVAITLFFFFLSHKFFKKWAQKSN